MVQGAVGGNGMADVGRELSWHEWVEVDIKSADWREYTQIMML